MSDENLKTIPKTKTNDSSRTKQSEDTLQQMISAIPDKVQVKKDEGPDILPKILIIAKGLCQFFFLFFVVILIK